MAVGTTLLIATGISAAIQAYAAHRAGSSADKATQAQLTAQQESTNKQSESDKAALDYLKEQQRKYEEMDAPFRRYREQALANLANLLGMPPPGGQGFGPEFGGNTNIHPPGQPPSLPPGQPPTNAPPTPPTQPTPPANNMLGASAMTKMVAPDGSMQDVPSYLTPYLQAKGARIAQ